MRNTHIIGILFEKRPDACTEYTVWERVYRSKKTTREEVMKELKKSVRDRVCGYGDLRGEYTYTIQEVDALTGSVLSFYSGILEYSYDINVTKLGEKKHV